tara:strand:- start:3393 stop:3620 length:228 start_codon:yes stop_codon:yes gene_type:complete
MIYASCPTCYFFIGNLVEQFEREKKKICSNVDLSEEEQEEKIGSLLRSLPIRRYCCRMRIMTCKDVVQEILPIVK